MAVKRLALGGFVKPVQITSPPALAFGWFGVKVTARVGLKSFATTIGTKIVTAQLMGKHEILARNHFHKANRVDK